MYRYTGNNNFNDNLIKKEHKMIFFKSKVIKKLLERISDVENKVGIYQKQAMCNHLETEMRKGYGWGSNGYEVCLSCNKKIQSFNTELEYQKRALSIANEKCKDISSIIAKVKKENENGNA